MRLGVGAMAAELLKWKEVKEGKKLNIYIAHNFEARLWLRENIVPICESNGHWVTSRWIKDDIHVELSRQFCALQDLDDIDRCSTLILFVDQFGDRAGKGKWFEFGYALRAGKRIILIGESSSCVFTNLPNVMWAKNIEEAMKLV